MNQSERPEDDGEIPGVSDAALSARDVENAREDGAAADLIGSPDEHFSLDGAQGDAGIDPAMEAVIEGGGGVSEGFELAEEQLVENATDSLGSTREITDDAIDEAEGGDDATYGEADHSQEQGYEDA